MYFCRLYSNSIIPEATDALSEAVFPKIGILPISSLSFINCGDIPFFQIQL